MILVLGGTKSGKSSFASRRALERESLGPVAYMATAQALDAEMEHRIRRHRADRPLSWITVEEPTDPAGCFDRWASGDAHPVSPVTVLVDCLTLWLTNLLAPMGDEPNRDAALEMQARESRRLIEAIAAWESGESPARRLAILVSNQVETGLISPWPLGRIFQDLAGLTHQDFAAAADDVYLITAGLPHKLK